MDITSKENLYDIVSLFYKKLLADDLLKSFFIKFENPQFLEEHLQTLVKFWSQVLFYTGDYQNNAMQPHFVIHQKTPIKKEHFKQWLFHFNNSVDELFKGDNAHTIKSRAVSIATVMEIKIGEMQKK